MNKKISSLLLLSASWASLLQAAPAAETRRIQSFAERLKAQKELRQEAKTEQAEDHNQQLSEHHSKFQKRVIEVMVIK